MKVITTIAGLAALAGLAGALAGCGGSGRPPGVRVSVVASTNVYADIAAQVAGALAGNRVAITALIADPAVDPHSYEANVRDELAVSRADLVIENGGGYDDFVDTLLSAAGVHPTVVDVVRLSGKRAVDGELNEHVWYDLPTVVRLADRIRDVLSARDPADRSTYTANAAAFGRAAAALAARQAAVRRSDAGTPVAVTEPVADYLLQACGLVDATPAAFSRAVEEGIDVPPRVLQQTEQLLSTHRVRALVYNAQAADAATTRVQQAALRAHVPVVAVTETLPRGLSYLGWQSGILDRLDAALAAGTT
jgi:zinc/manganese transport system substrate-binding protein